MGTIHNVSSEELPIIIAGLVERGIVFEVYAAPGTMTGVWDIRITGGR